VGTSGNHPHTRVFVYGSLLSASRRRAVLGRKVRMLPARLPDYERGRARYFYIVPRPGVETAGAILLNLDARDLAALDRYEELPDLYTREAVTVITAGGGRITCWCYLPTQRVTGER
jgi:gamma-glutamylcyclotransferase (GGCT)/AIG2-like uncharacterized protein YtfP